MFAEIDGPGWINIITAIGAIVTSIFGGLILYNTTKSKNRIEEMRIQAELEKARNEGRHEAQSARMEAQKAVSLVNANALTNVQQLLAANTMETMKSTTAADQVKVRVEQLEQRLPVKQSEANPNEQSL